MAGRRVTACVAAMVAGISMGAGGDSVAHGQTTPRRTAPGNPMVEVFGSSGGWIGVTVRDASEAEAQTSKLPGASGVVVDDVAQGSPAETAGLKTGDLIVEYDGERVRGTRQFSRLVQETPPGRNALPGVLRTNGNLRGCSRREGGSDAQGTIHRRADGQDPPRG